MNRIFLQTKMKRHVHCIDQLILSPAGRVPGGTAEMSEIICFPCVFKLSEPKCHPHRPAHRRARFVQLGPKWSPNGLLRTPLNHENHLFYWRFLPFRVQMEYISGMGWSIWDGVFFVHTFSFCSIPSVFCQSKKLLSFVRTIPSRT